MSNQTLFAFGFNAFQQCGDQNSTSTGGDVRQESPAILASFQGQPSIVGLAATWSASFSCCDDGCLSIWGFTEPFVGVKGLSQAKIRLSSEKGQKVKKIVPARWDIRDRHESTIYVLTGEDLRLLTFEERSKETPQTGQLKRKLDDMENGPFFEMENMDNSAENRTFRIKQHIFPFQCHDVAVTCLQVCAITSSGDILTWALGSTAYRRINPDTPQVNFRSLAAGGTHFLAISTTNDLYTWGYGLKGQLGHGNSEVREREIPIAVEALQGLRVTTVAGGGWHSAATTKDGDLYTFGSSEHRQLGLPDQDQSAIDAAGFSNNITTNDALPNPVDMDFSSAELMLSCGSNHTAISDGTTLYGCGWNKYGQLGPVDVGEDVQRLRQIDLPRLADGQKIISIVCGGWHTLVLIEWESIHGS
ncbi:hypothetical protein SpCBS45565_g07628 [Spizellomyces sp. 'palustris']|nr:hypothetical protein SpCBS45565_g07628 [Spizellomyces sp. 'palustris']